MIKEHEAEALGYLFGQAGEICEPSIGAIKNDVTLLAAFRRGWWTGRGDKKRDRYAVTHDGGAA